MSNKRAKPEVRANETQLNILNLCKCLSKFHVKQGLKWHVFIVRVKLFRSAPLTLILPMW